jgi:uncharacterized protein (TIGR00369 family)
VTGLEQLRAAETAGGFPGIGELLGMEILALGEGHVEIGLMTRAEFANPAGSLHGGISATLLDSVLALAVHSTLPDGVGYTTLDLAVKYLRPVAVAGVRLRAIGNVVHRGRQVVTGEATVRDEADRLVATGTATCLVVPGRQSGGGGR